MNTSILKENTRSLIEAQNYTNSGARSSIPSHSEMNEVERPMMEAKINIDNSINDENEVKPVAQADLAMKSMADDQSKLQQPSSLSQKLLVSLGSKTTEIVSLCFFLSSFLLFFLHLFILRATFINLPHPTPVRKCRLVFFSISPFFFFFHTACTFVEHAFSSWLVFIDIYFFY